MAEKSLILMQQENLELNKENSALKDTVSTLLVEIDQLRNAVLTPSNPDITKSEDSSALNIINEQIRVLEIFSRVRILTLEEIRALDLLIKNKKILVPQEPMEADYTKIPEGKTESDLLQLAGQSGDTKRKSETSTDDSVA